MKERCSQRQTLSDRVVAAIQAVCRARKTPGADKVMLLQKMREEQRAAERELNAHVKEHGCR
jgi:hypothetical protein